MNAVEEGVLAGSRRPLVSVIIPAYDVEDYIGPAIESALAQCYPNVEVVVVNDGSTDSTPAVIARYAGRVVVVDQENQGLAGARNAGLRVARGEYIALLDGDDTWLPERIERLVSVLDAHPELAMVTSDSYVMEGFEPTEKRSYVHRRKRPFPATVEDQVPEIARFNFLFIGVLFRRELMDRFGMFLVGPRRGLPGSIEGAEDYELWTRYVVNGARAGYIDEPLGYYRVRPGSLSQSPHQGVAHQNVLQRHLPALWKQGARGYARDAYDIATRVVMQGDRRTAVPFFWHAVRGEGAEGSRLRYAASSVRRLVVPHAHGSAIDRRLAASAPPAG